MAKVTVKLAGIFSKMFDPSPDSRDMQDLGDEVVDQMKSMIADGQSPISGKGNYKPYKNPQKYPGKKKSHSPVNLELSGDMLSDLKAVASSDRVVIGYRDPAQVVKEQGHREGVKGQPKRPSVPLVAEGEKFKPEIATLIRERIKDMIRATLRKG